MQENLFDIAVIGGGITGAAAAANLAISANVLVLERESQPGYDATGRSAAVFSQTLGSAAMRSLSQASRPFFHTPPPAFSDTPLVSPRGKLYIASANQLDALAGLAGAPGVAEFHDMPALTKSPRWRLACALVMSPRPCTNRRRRIWTSTRCCRVTCAGYAATAVD
jgi:glycine/D-amino acid oxidase-like deaminating enzyme